MSIRPIKVLVIDDSALVREMLTKILSKDPAIQVVGQAIDPLFAIKRIKEQKPDVLTLDLEMPRMDGLTFLEKLMSIYPMPVVVISSLALKGSSVTLKALELGAVDFVTKPKLGIGAGLDDMASEIIEKVKNAAAVNMREIRRIVRQNKAENLLSQGASGTSHEIPKKEILVRSTDKIIAIGASTGGTVAVKNILQKLPANLPGIIVVLHMPAGFTNSYAQGLDSACRLRVKEAVHGDQLSRGTVFIAPGGKHLILDKNPKGYYLKTDESPPLNRHRPSVDKTFLSIAQKASPNSMGIILTGMGEDGARGLRAMYDEGCLTIVQDEKTSVVFGMPKQAIAMGGVKEILPLEKIAQAIIDYAS